MEGKETGSLSATGSTQRAARWSAMDGHRVHPFLFLLLVVFSVYFRTLFYDFVFDDIPNVLKNRWIRDIRYLPEIFSTHLAGFNSGYPTSYYRPLVHVIYLINYHVFGLQPWGFHLVNILFHAAVSVLVFLIASRVLAEPRPSDSLAPPSLFAALFFAAHPIHSEAVSWVSGIMDLSYTCFYLASFYLYIRSRSGDRSEAVRYYLSVASFFLAVLCKEPGLALPVLLLLYDAMFQRDKFSLSNCAKRYLPYLLVGVVYLSMRILALEGLVPSKSSRGLSGLQVVINIFPLFVGYLGKLILPVRLNVLHVFDPVRSVLEFQSMVSLILTLGIGIVAYMMRKNKVVLIGCALIVVPLSPALYLPGIVGEVAFAERYLYLPSVGFVLLLAFLLDQAKKILPGKAVHLSVLSIVLVGLYSLGTVSRNRVWKDSYSLWKDTAIQSPGSAVAHEYLGYALYAEGRIDEAIQEYRAALTLNPDRADARINLGVAYHGKGWLDQAMEQYRIGLSLRPDDAEANMNLGLALMDKGSLGQAIDRCRIAIELDPYLAGAYNCLGSAYGRKGSIEEAIVFFRGAVRLDPNDPVFTNNLVKAEQIQKETGR